MLIKCRNQRGYTNSLAPVNHTDSIITKPYLRRVENTEYNWHPETSVVPFLIFHTHCKKV